MVALEVVVAAGILAIIAVIVWGFFALRIERLRVEKAAIYAARSSSNGYQKQEQGWEGILSAVMQNPAIVNSLLSGLNKKEE